MLEYLQCIFKHSTSFPIAKNPQHNIMLNNSMLTMSYNKETQKFIHLMFSSQ